jgi:hypothetical protein
LHSHHFHSPPVSPWAHTPSIFSASGNHRWR